MTEPRTSKSHPLRIDEVQVPGPGRLGMTFAPGKVQPDARSGAWARNLEDDLRALVEGFGATVLVTALESHELEDLQVSQLPERAIAHGMTSVWVSIPDGGVTPKDEELWRLVCRIRTAVRSGEHVVVHCKGGLGRTGMIVACVLTTFGVDPHGAMVAVRRAREGAIEHGAQERKVEAAASWWRASRVSRVRGSLVGGALGDALGAPIEFDSLDGIRRRSGAEGLRFMARAYGRVGAITDDTQMTLFTAEGLLRAAAKERRDGSWSPLPSMERAYLRWLWTQGEEAREDQEWIHSGWLFRQGFLHHRRAPGNTCLSALEHRASLGPTESRMLDAVLNDSKGCGGVMRVAPIGLLGREPYALGCAAAGLTHGHPAGTHSAGVFAEVLAELLEGATMEAAVSLVWARRRAEVHADVRDAVDRALSMAASDTPPTATQVEALGAGWVAEESLAIAIYCALVAEDAEEGLILAVNHSGDSDSTGSLTGNLLGAAWGYRALPSTWIAQLEGAFVIDNLAQDLAGLRVDGEVDEARYPPT